MSKVIATDAGPRETSTPSRPAGPPETDLPTAGLDHQLAKQDHASEGVTSRLRCLAVFGEFFSAAARKQETTPWTLEPSSRSNSRRDSHPGWFAGPCWLLGELLLSAF